MEDLWSLLIVNRKTMDFLLPLLLLVIAWRSCEPRYAGSSVAYDGISDEVIQINKRDFHFDREFGDDFETDIQSLQQMQQMSLLTATATATATSRLSLSQSEWLALQSLYRATGGPGWTWYGKGAVWNFTSGYGYNDPCAQGWEGVLCSCNLTKPRTIYKDFYPYYSYYDDSTTAHSINASIVCTVEKLFLNRHNLRGSIPSAIGDLTNVRRVHLSSNSLSGSFPSGLLRLANLEVLCMGRTRINGSIPTNLGRLTALRVVSIFKNSLSGTLPKEFSLLTKLEKLYFYDSSLRGTLPVDYSRLINLQGLFLYYNNLVGSLPIEYSALSAMQSLLLNANHFTGSLPSQYSRLSKLQTLYLISNSLSGVLPSAWSSLTTLQQLAISSNQLYGPLPPEWSAMASLQLMVMASNSLSGPIPYQWSKIKLLQNISLSSNRLTGAIPYQWGSALTAINILDLSFNQLAHSIPSEIGIGIQSLKILLLDNNYLTGIIPTSIFQLPLLSTLSLSVNCLAIESFAVSNMCAAQKLSVLLLDGIHSALQCGNQILFQSRLFGAGRNTYTLPASSIESAQGKATGVALPICLLSSMPYLTTLHASGAGLVGSISSLDDKSQSTKLAPNLKDLILSHNYLTGPIALSVQSRRSWVCLDMRSNLFDGTLATDLQYNDTAVIDLSNNRLSGSIPRGLLYKKNCSILEGNSFVCPLFNRTVNLPIHDPKQSEYSCGSNTFTVSVFVWACILASCSLVAFFVYRYDLLDTMSVEILSFLSTHGIMRNSTSPLRLTVKLATHVDLFENSLRSVRISMIVAAGIISGLMLVYALFKIYGYSSVAEHDAYRVAVIQLEGIEPAVFIGALYLIIVFGCYVLFRQYFTRDKSERKALDAMQVREAEEASGQTTNNLAVNALMRMKMPYKQWLRYFLIGFVNIFVSSVINGAYVAAYLSLSSSNTDLISFALSVFKVLWSRIGVSFLLSLGSSSRNKNKSPLVADSRETLNDTKFYVVLIVINTVIIPSLAIIIVAPNCALTVFQAPPPITSEFPFCEIYNGYLLNGTFSTISSCLTSRTILTSYTGPFLYSYQCSAALLNGYAGVFTYVFTLIAFVNPVAVALLLICINKLQHSPDSWLFCMAADLLPQYCLPVEYMNKGKALTSAKIYRHFSSFLSRTSTETNDFASSRDASTITVIGIELPVALDSGNNYLDRTSCASVTSPISFAIDQSSLAYANEKGMNAIANRTETSCDDTEVQIEGGSSRKTSSSLKTQSESATIFRASYLVVQLNQLLSVCLSFGMVFPPLCLLGALAVVVHSLFIQITVRRFAQVLQTSYKSSSSLAPVDEYLSLLNQECDFFYIAMKECLPIPFMTSYLILGFFLFEIVGLKYPYQSQYTILLPLLFLVLAWGMWQLLRAEKLRKWWGRIQF